MKFNLFGPRRLSLAEDARRDAGLGIDSEEEHIRRRLGARPRSLSPTRHHGDAQVAGDLRLGGIVDEVGTDLEQAEEDLAEHTGTYWYLAGVAVTIVGESLAGIRTAHTIGVRETERIPVGLMLALMLMAATALVARFVKRDRGGSSAPPTAAMRVFLIAIYVIVVTAVAAVRLRAEGDIDLGAIGSVVLMVAVTIAPAWLAEAWLHKYLAARTAARRVRRLRRKLRTNSRRHIRAMRFTAERSEGGARWDAQAERLAAEYRAEHKSTQAAKDNPAHTTKERSSP